VRGDVLGGKLRVSGTNQMFPLAGAIEDGKDLTLEGTLVPLKNLKATVPVLVRRVAGKGK
jgi:hypothetical protein